MENFVLKKYSPSCWYVFKQLLFELTGCRQYELGSYFRIIGTVGSSGDNEPKDVLLLELSEVILVSASSSLAWYHPKYIQSQFYQAREKIGQKLLLVLPQAEAALLFSIFFGGIAYLPEELKQAVTYLGVQHLMAASGMQVSLLLATCSRFWKWLSRTTSFLLQVALLILYAQLALLSVSIVRAVTQRISAMIVRNSLRQFSVSWVFFLTTCVFTQTLSIDSQVAFQLSFMAVVGLQFGRLFEQSLSVKGENFAAKKTIYNNIKTYIREVIITSICVQIWLFPLLMIHFGQMSSMSLISTVSIVWLLGPLFSFGIPVLSILVFLPKNLIQAKLILLLSWPLHNLLSILSQLFGVLETFRVAPIVVAIPNSILILWYVLLLFLYWWLDYQRIRRIRQNDLKMLLKSY